MSEKRPIIKYTNREFDSIKQDLINYHKNFYPDIAKDLNKGTPDSLIFDEVAYVGDQLSLNLDYYANECFPDTAIEPNNIIRHAKYRGYKFRNYPSTYGTCHFYVNVPADSLGTAPNNDYLPVLKRNSTVSTNGGKGFILIDDVDFSKVGNLMTVAAVDATSGVPTYYTVEAAGRVISGELREEYINIGAFKKFLKIAISSKYVTEVLKVIDSNGNEFYEVEYLSQDVIYRPIINHNASSKELVTNILKPYPVPRRFVTEQEKGITYLIFGYGSEADIDETSPVDPKNTVLDVFGKDYLSDTGFDPYKLISTDKFGISPSNTTLRIIYRVNSSQNANAVAGSITKTGEANFEFKTSTNAVVALTRRQVESSLAVMNKEPILGDVSFPTIEELRVRASNAFATQNRAVTSNDYASIAYSMPSSYGSIKRVMISKDKDSFKRNLNFYVVSEDQNGNLATCNATIKNNLKVWIENYKMINDTIDILNARIINLGVNFIVVAEAGRSKVKILSDCISALINEFSTKPNIGEPFAIEKIYKILNKINYVTTTVSVEVERKAGGVYSTTKFNVEMNTSNDGRYIYFAEDHIWEIKYPRLDIKGIVR